MNSITSKYFVYILLLGSGERLPMLLFRETYEPVSLPLRYIIDERRETKQANTLARDVRVLGWFYEWADSVGINLETQLRHGLIPTVSEITGFCRYLRTQRLPMLVGAIGMDEPHPKILSPTTFNSYLAVVQSFLEWAIFEFIPRATSTESVTDTVETAKERIKRAFRNHYLGGRMPQKRYGLTADEVRQIREVVKPGGLQNPFRKDVQFRNYLMVEVLLMTGIRRGELLKIKNNHLPYGAKDTLTIERSPDDQRDPRRHEPQVKTRPREIPIPKKLAAELARYLAERKHRKRISHPYLFISHSTGSPLSETSVNWLFAEIVKESLPSLKGRLSPHVLRHTFNEALFEQGLALKWSDQQIQKIQTYLNGWAENSVMPEVYMQRLIEVEATKLLESYQSTLYKDLTEGSMK